MATLAPQPSHRPERRADDAFVNVQPCTRAYDTLRTRQLSLANAEEELVMLRRSFGVGLAAAGIAAASSAAVRRKWIVVDMKTDWKVIFPCEMK